MALSMLQHRCREVWEGARSVPRGPWLGDAQGAAMVRLLRGQKQTPLPYQHQAAAVTPARRLQGRAAPAATSR